MLFRSALSNLENATSGWTNVKDQTYSMGVTTFKTNAYTGCSWTSCDTNKYTLSSRTAKARMITTQEALLLGCASSNQSCPVWMHNYLKDSSKWGGTVDSAVEGYWTMSTMNNGSYAMYIMYIGKFASDFPQSFNKSARAVVVIDK